MFAIVIVPIIIGAIIGVIDRSATDKFDKYKLALSDREQDLKREAALIEEKRISSANELSSLFLKKQAELENAFSEMTSQYEQDNPWLAKQVADFITLYDERTYQKILTRRSAHPETVVGLRKSLNEKKHYIQLYKQAQYQLAVYESVFPFLQEFREVHPADIPDIISSSVDDKPDYDRVRDWLSKEEYSALDPNVREMLALERYISRKKTNWEVGIEYEQYVGYQCERRGYRVEYTGATQGLEDMGRDLVLTARDGRAVVIQCKRWSSEKTIHEKHIFQLYGTVVTMSVKHKIPVVGVFVTTTNLSDLARDCAHALGVLVVENYPMADYPRIKCNIGKNGERIYHMPYDQQYNNVVISRDKGEFYTFTNEEAQSRGYRRAWRWHGS